MVPEYETTSRQLPINASPNALAINGIDYLPLLEEIRVTSLVIVGREDADSPLALAEQLATTSLARSWS